MYFGNPEGGKFCMEAQSALNASVEKSTASGSDVALVTSDDPATDKEIDALSEAKKGDEEDLNDFIKRTCVWCMRANDPTLEFLVRSPGIWLHALQYTVEIDGKVTSFRTCLPSFLSPPGSNLQS